MFAVFEIHDKNSIYYLFAEMSFCTINHPFNRKGQREVTLSAQRAA
jgi:hypothetical protein